ncbi:universal stress protein PHOS32-like [Curcuma longa]|uniref:universal stress protein PHOS32-like n=1 Tax=Curcuma longa TaxID=136217 RepID=UPI003D9F6DB2
MGRSSRTSPRLPGFCFNRIAGRVRVRSPPPGESKPPPPPTDNAVEPEPEPAEEEAEVAAIGRRRIMIVVDTSPESKTAMLWALSHAVQTSDCVVLVNAVKPSSKHGDRSSDSKSHELLHSMKNICQAKKPEVAVEVSVVEATERGAAIVEEARKQGASLLVMGQKRRSFTWRLVMLWAGNKISGSVADYCVQNATCMAVAVRRKSRRGGGYLITTKRHKDFWLLA